MSNRVLPCAICALALALLPGCGEGTAGSTVSGKVLVNGKPAERAIVCLVPVDGSPLRPSAVAAADGSFEMKTDDRVRAGDYYVTVVWPNYKTDGGEEIQTDDRLKGRYETVAKAFKKITVQPGANNLEPFQLKGP